MRLMLEPERAPPDGWLVVRTVTDMLEALASADPTEITDVSVRAGADDAAEVAAAALRAATSAFHLLRGFQTMQAIHFHDPDLRSAQQARDQAARGGGHSIGVTLDTDVPLGGQSLWRRRDGVVLLAGVQIPETTTAVLIGEPLARLLSSPMMDKGHLIETITHDGFSTVVKLKGP